MADNNQVIIPAVVAIVAVVGMVILFSGQGRTGAFDIVGAEPPLGLADGLDAAWMCPNTEWPEFGECCSKTCALAAGTDSQLHDACQYHCKQAHP